MTTNAFGTHEPWHCPSTQNGVSVPAQDGFSPHLQTFPSSSSGCSSCLHSASRNVGDGFDCTTCLSVTKIVILK